MSLATSYAKALAGAVPVPLVGGRSYELPEREVTRDDVHVDREHLSRYTRVCGFALRDTLPATYPHMLAFPLSMELMTDRSFPFPLLGLVHVENQIEQRRPVYVDETLSLRVWAENLRPHAKGRQLDLVACGEVDGDAVWSSRSTYLRRGKGGDDDAPRGLDVPVPDRQIATFKVPGDIGRRYASVSGDRNPIHLHPLSARLFGFPSAIAHGMWTKARAMAQFDGRLPDAYSVAVAFKAPLRIPAQVRLTSDGAHFALLPAKEGGREHLVGSFDPPPRA